MNNEPFGIITTSGAEVISNDREMKYILRREIIFYGAIENETFNAYCYVKEGSGWIKTTNTLQYSSVHAFIKAVAGFPGFSRAAGDLEQHGFIKDKEQ